MTSRTGPKVKLSRRLGVPIADTPKHINCKRLETPPGGYAKRHRRLSDYGIRLREKEKLQYYYNLREKQMRIYVARATQKKGNTGENLMRALERRLDNVVRRAGFARTIWQARQMVGHGHFLVNGRKVDRPGYEVRPGDVITVKEKSRKWMGDNLELNRDTTPPAWMDLNRDNATLKITDLPDPEPQLPFPINLGLIVEYYN